MIFALGVRRQSRRRFLSSLGMAAVWVGCAWFTVETAVLNPIGVAGPTLPVSSGAHLLGRIFIWGILPALLFPCQSLWSAGAVVGMADLALLQWATGRAAPSLLLWELLGLLFAFAPAQLFYRWTRDERELEKRAALHVAYYTGLLLWVVPAVSFELLGGSFTPVVERPAWLNKFLAQIIVVPGVMGVAATMELVKRGGGTPMPTDAPRRLVTSGPYAYVANPIQISKVLLLALWGVFLGSGGVVLSAVAVAAYGLTMARPRENRELKERFGRKWLTYRHSVRVWWPRWHPWTDPDAKLARLYYRAGCHPCEDFAVWLAKPANLQLVRVGEGTTELTRITYQVGDGSMTDEGIGAIGRALEHRNLGWAFIGWAMRLPLLRQLFQLIADAVAGDETAGRYGRSPGSCDLKPARPNVNRSSRPEERASCRILC